MNRSFKAVIPPYQLFLLHEHSLDCSATIKDHCEHLFMEKGRVSEKMDNVCENIHATLRRCSQTAHSAFNVPDFHELIMRCSSCYNRIFRVHLSVDRMDEKNMAMLGTL